MKFSACLITAVFLALSAEMAPAQNTRVDGQSCPDMDAYFGNQTGEFIRYCHQELFSKFEKRRFGLTPLYGQSHSFELWADSLDRRYLVSVDIAEQSWEITRQRSIPLLYKKYTEDYNIEAYVEIFYRGMAKPIMAKKYQIVMNGKTSYQLLKNDPDWYKLYVPFRHRLAIEKLAIKSLAARLSSDLFTIIN